MRLLTLRTILVATDLTEVSAAAVATGARLAEAAGAKLHVAHVTSGSEDRSARDVEREMEREFDAAKTAARPTTHLLGGEPAPAISALADKLSADVVVLGRRRGERGAASERPVGSTAYAFVTQTLVPALVVVEPLSTPLPNALVAIDTSEAARGSLLVALSWASALRPRESNGGALTILHVDTGTGDEEGDVAGEKSEEMRRAVAHDADVLQRNAPGWAGVTVEKLTVTNPDPTAAIAQHAIDSEAGLVVLGTRSSHAHGKSIWGSVSAAVTRRLSVPVLLVPPAVWRNYVRDVDPF
jgi:nucleotide-binding universal stress UspA family protein